MGEALLRILALVAIFASIFLVSQLGLGALWRNRAKVAAVNKRLSLIKQGADRLDIDAQLRKNAPREYEELPAPLRSAMRGLQRALFASASSLTLGQLLLWMGAGVAFITIVLLFLAAFAGFSITAGVILLALTLAASVSVGLPIVVINMIAQRRKKKMEQQFPVALDIFVRALRSGHPVAGAITLLTNEMEDPIGSEFGLVADEIAYGADLTDALESMAERWDLEDIRMFVVSLAVQSETGGNLAEIIENLAEVIRARASLYLKVRALSSEGRMTGWILTVLPVLTFVGMFLVNPKFYLNVAQDIIFMVGLPLLIMHYFLGVFWIRKLVDIKV